MPYKLQKKHVYSKTINQKHKQFSHLVSWWQNKANKLVSAGVNNLYLSVYSWIHKISSTLTLKVIDSLPYNQRIPFTNVNIPWKVILLIQGWTGHLVPKQVHVLPCTCVLITHFNIFHNSEFKHNMSPLQWDVTALLLHHNNTHADRWCISLSSDKYVGSHLELSLPAWSSSSMCQSSMSCHIPSSPLWAISLQTLQLEPISCLEWPGMTILHCSMLHTCRLIGHYVISAIKGLI